MKYYGVNDKYGSDMCAWQMAVEACQQLDGDIDFSVYDNDNDGLIDNVYVFYAGYGEHDGGRFQFGMAAFMGSGICHGRSVQL